ncbi:glyoxalase [Rhodococcus sp. 05-2255-3B1]|uniref:VOC family protein n=1 Tax=unclassified Rhodococcus (in: high G+C Gram-positive bacteria) TaxID=192944 RepID=UPI000B9B6BBD|nr:MULTISPECIES: VOC family protein [unclassified Rhodococcus (in: high G+C Gram-positive bacteria)]OZE08537.1 glyoxalase [Rhodococcus sp. 05-2255-3C]OZE12572.1 glyoxalase [Rhodococcus sp. 05-2255-3B1]OZE16799.1 glyoxalase [Rhodococcus sp. 05-2255-2A2]
MTTPTRNRLQEGGAVGTLRRTAVSHLGFTVPDVAATAGFYGRTVGLTVQEELAGGGLRLGWGLGHHVLDLTEGPKALSHYGFEVRDADGIAGITARLKDAGHDFTDLDPSVLDHAVGAPSGISVTDPDRTTVHFHGPVARQGENAADPGRRPIKFQHTTLGTDNVAQMVSFFVDTVGFRISDQLEDGKFAWLRSDRDHHTLAVVENGVPGDLDHYSYDLAEWEDFKSWCDRLTEIGVDVVWGPGRHGPGNNLFVFFDDPAGNHIELSAEMEKFHDDRATYVTRQWRPVPASVNLWGGQLASWRKTSESEI